MRTNYAFEEGQSKLSKDIVFAEIAILKAYTPKFLVFLTGRLHFEVFRDFI